MKKRMNRVLVVLLATALTLLFAGHAMASTSAGETVSNLATLDYQVNGIDQTQLESNNGVTTDFLVDLLVNPLITRQTAATINVTPGETDAEHTFRVDNLGNDTDTLGTDQYFELTIDTPTDDLSISSILADIDTNNDGAPEFTDVDVSTGYILQIDTENHVTVTLKADVPLAATDTQTTIYDLIATAVDSVGTALIASGPATAGVDIVLADLAASDTASGAADNDGRDADRGTFEAQSAALSITKSDSVAGGYYIPGATVTYSITVENTGTNAASLVTISDAIPADTTYAGSLACGLTGSTAQVFDSSSSWVDEGTETLPVTDVRCLEGSITAGGGTGSLVFDVTID